MLIKRNRHHQAISPTLGLHWTPGSRSVYMSELTGPAPVSLVAKHSPHWAALRFLRWCGRGPFRGLCWQAGAMCAQTHTLQNYCKSIKRHRMKRLSLSWSAMLRVVEPIRQGRVVQWGALILSSVFIALALLSFVHQDYYPAWLCIAIALCALGLYWGLWFWLPRGRR